MFEETERSKEATRELEERKRKEEEARRKHDKEWSLDACIARGCLPTGEAIEAKFGVGWWTKDND